MSTIGPQYPELRTLASGDVLVAQGKLDEALKSYRDSLAIRERLVAADRSNAQWQNDLQFVIERIGSLSFDFLLAGDFAQAIAVTDEVIALAPEELWPYTNRAHALTFVGRIEEHVRSISSIAGRRTCGPASRGRRPSLKTSSNCAKQGLCTR
jgi:tetratricopeptide (TPR) repeat protein